MAAELAERLEAAERDREATEQPDGGPAPEKLREAASASRAAVAEREWLEARLRDAEAAVAEQREELLAQVERDAGQERETLEARVREAEEAAEERARLAGAG